MKNNKRIKKFSFCDRSATPRNPIYGKSDVIDFFDHLHFDCNAMVHPDDKVSDTVNADGEHLFSELQGLWLNLMMANCRALCRLDGLDIYRICIDSVKRVYAMKLAGKRVVAKSDIRYYPHVAVDEGEMGTVVEADDEMVSIKLDKHDSRLDEWNNCIVYYHSKLDMQSHSDFLIEWKEADPAQEPKQSSDLSVDKVSFGDGNTGIVLSDGSGVIVKLMGKDDLMDILYPFLNTGINKGHLYGYDTECP